MIHLRTPVTCLALCVASCAAWLLVAPTPVAAFQAPSVPEELSQALSPGQEPSGQEEESAPEIDEESAGQGQADGGGRESGPILDMGEILEGDPSKVMEVSTWTNLGERLLAKLVDFLPNFVYALIILALFFLLWRVSARLFRGVLRRTGADPALQHIGLRVVKIILITLAVIMAASQLGFQVASLLTGLGVAGLAVGLAAQETLANLVAGFTILWDRPFRIGDNVTIAGTFGQVKGIGLRSTRIRTVEQLDAVLPNKEVINQEIINHTLNPRLRLGVPLGIAYKEDTREARRVLLEAVEGHPLLVAEPAPEVVVTALADSSVNLELRVWLKDPHTERKALCEMLELSKIALDEAGIEIPFPQRTLHLGDERVAAPLVRRLEAGGGGGSEG